MDVRLILAIIITLVTYNGVTINYSKLSFFKCTVKGILCTKRAILFAGPEHFNLINRSYRYFVARAEFSPSLDGENEPTE